MSTAILSTPLTASRRAPARRILGFLCLVALALAGLALAFPSHALDLVAFTGITGPASIFWCERGRDQLSAFILGFIPAQGRLPGSEC